MEPCGARGVQSLGTRPLMFEHVEKLPHDCGCCGVAAAPGMSGVALPPPQNRFSVWSQLPSSSEVAPLTDITIAGLIV